MKGRRKYKTAIHLGIFLLPPFVVWLVFSFFNLDLNPLNWHPISQTFAVIVSSTLSVYLEEKAQRNSLI